MRGTTVIGEWGVCGWGMGVGCLFVGGQGACKNIIYSLEWTALGGKKLISENFSQEIRVYFENMSHLNQMKGAQPTYPTIKENVQIKFALKQIQSVISEKSVV